MARRLGLKAGHTTKSIQNKPVFSEEPVSDALLGDFSTLL